MRTRALGLLSLLSTKINDDYAEQTTTMYRNLRLVSDAKKNFHKSLDICYVALSSFRRTNDLPKKC